jgi:aldose 1-epimerase
MGIIEKPFGTASDKPVKIYTLTNQEGNSARITNYGAIVQSLILKDGTGSPVDVVLGYDSLQGYLTDNPYFGAIVGRYGNRIGQSRFILDGVTWLLNNNDGPNHLHGGLKGFDKVVWDARPFIDSAGPCLELHYLSPDGEEGYPGALDVKVVYCLTHQNVLRITYEATTSKPTVVNLTHHGYFNLSGNTRRNILAHLLWLNADSMTAVDSTLIPTGEIASVARTPFDFTTEKPIGERIREVFNVKTGYDNNFVLRGMPGEFRHAATVTDPQSHIRMEVWTDQPGIQFYSGNFLDGSITGKFNTVYEQYHGFCLETQHFPDSPNQPAFPPTALRPGEIYKSVTEYRFDVIKP